MEQQRALTALEPYLALSKSATSPRAAADLINQATSAPNTYVFAELLQTPNIQALAQSADYAPHLRLLEIFAWGTYADYASTSNLPTLTTSQQRKLQLLSLLPLCASPTTLTYIFLTQSLSLPSFTALESLITTAIYVNLIHGHLDPLHQCVVIDSVAPLRDLPPNSVPGHVATLDAWEARCDGALEDIEGRIERIKSQAAQARERRVRREQAFEDAVAAVMASAAEGEQGRGNGGVGAVKGGKRAAPETGEDVMDVDLGDPGRGGTRTRRAGRLLGMKF